MSTKGKILFLLPALIFSLILFSSESFSQNLTQTIRGLVIDRETKVPLPGASVVLLDYKPFTATTSDADGNFRLPDVKIGRLTLKISYIGYEDKIISGIEVVSARETVLNIEMSKTVYTSKEVVITGNASKENTINSMSVLSTRMFSVEETSMYAGAWGDPSRMASHFAGVTVTSDKRNDIIIRGNSPIGMLWRLEGIQIPNPNHFAIAGSSGGAISMINNNLLDNSDFSTSAFSAEYGNALSGVFDLKLRNGNNEKREYLFQLGAQGVEVGAEGPFVKEKKSSYIINYRYSTLAFLSLAGIKIIDAIPDFQDLSVKLNFPFKKGHFSIFGIGGMSMADEKVIADSTTWEDKYDQMNYISGSKTGVTALSLFHLLGKKTYMKLILSASAFNPFYSDDSVGFDYMKYKLYNISQTEIRNISSLLFNSELKAGNVIRYGVIFNQIKSSGNSYYCTYNSGIAQKEIIDNKNVSTSLIQGFFLWKYEYKNKILFTGGLHSLYLLLNQNFSIEPRAAIRWNINGNNSLSLGFGKHNMMQPLPIYFSGVYDNNENFIYTNKDLSFTEAYHFVLGYDKMLAENLRMKTEIYCQNIKKVPVSKDNPIISLINFGSDDNIFITEKYMNSGKGINYGAEFTAEKFFCKNSYFLITTSLFNSKYCDGNGIWHNTRYNVNHSANILAGKEFKPGEKKNNIIGVNGTFVWIGGQYYTPVDIPASQFAGSTVYIDSLAYTNRTNDYIRVDLRIRYRLNKKKVSHEIAFELANIFNRKNIEKIQYDVNTGEMKYHYDLNRIPLVFYRLLF